MFFCLDFSFFNIYIIRRGNKHEFNAQKCPENNIFLYEVVRFFAVHFTIPPILSHHLSRIMTRSVLNRDVIYPKSQRDLP